MTEASLPQRLQECPECGLFVRLAAPAPGMVAYCRRCSGVLRRGRRNPLGNALAMALAGLLLLGVAFGAPLLAIDLDGRTHSAGLFSGPASFEQDGMELLAGLVLATTIVLPLLRLSAMVGVLLGLHLPHPPRRLFVLFKLAGHLRPWSMVEVYLLGLFVAYSKLVDLAQIRVETGAFALAGAMLAMAACDAALDAETVWEALARRGLVAEPRKLAPALARAARPGIVHLGCPECGLVLAADAPAPGAITPCPRCGARGRARKRGSLSRCWALLLAAAVLYIPANAFPILTLVSFGQRTSSTILSGVGELAAAGMWPLAILVFVASITVPLLKLIGLASLLIGVHRTSRGRLRERTRLFRIIDAVGRWSMIDVFMLSVLVGLVRLGLLASVQPGIGAVAFASVVILTMLAAGSFDPRLMWDAAAARGRARQTARAEPAGQSPA